MKNRFVSTAAAFALAFGLTAGDRLDARGGKSSSTGNQLASKKTPVTQEPASQVGSAEGIEAPVGGSLLVLKAGSVLYIAGDSTLHEWEMGAKTLQGSAALKGKAEGLEKALKAGGNTGAMKLVVPVEALKSKEKRMDDNAYKALKPKDHPEIVFSLGSLTLSNNGTFSAKGKLSISGTTKEIGLSGKAEFVDGGIRLTGVQKLKMTDFGIQPPSISLLVTSIDCKDDIAVHYDVAFGPKE